MKNKIFPVASTWKILLTQTTGSGKTLLRDFKIKTVVHTMIFMICLKQIILS